MIQQAIRKKARQWFFETFPELDPGEECLGSRLVSINLQLAALRTPPKAATRVATVVLLVEPPLQQEPQPEGAAELMLDGRPLVAFSARPPRFISGSTVITPSTIESRWGSEPEYSVELPLHWAIPAGSWLVAHGCTFARVHVGNQHQDTGPHGQFCQLSDRVPLGVRLTVRVKG
jgi:hypothetical protein